MICECVVIHVGEEEVRGHAGHTLLAATMAPSLPRSAPAPLLLLLLLRVLLLFSPAVRTHGTVMPRQFCCCTDRFIRTLGGGLFFCAGRAGRAPGGHGARRGEGRQTGGHFGSPSFREAELQGHGEERQGAHPGRSEGSLCISPLFAAIQVFLMFNERRIGEIPGETELLSAAQIFWSFNLANWPPRQPDRLSPSPPPALPRLLLAVFGHTLRHLCLFVDSCLILLFFYFLLIHVLVSPCVTSIQPSPCCPLTHRKGFFCFFMFSLPLSSLKGLQLLKVHCLVRLLLLYICLMSQ